MTVWLWQFTAHPSCQKKLTTLWHGDGHFDKLLRRRSKLVQISLVACIVLLYPVLSLIYIVAPKSLVSACASLFGGNWLIIVKPCS